MFEDFFNHKCNIYHIAVEKEQIGYGFSESDTIFKYPDTPDIKNQRCHFHNKSNSVSLTQKEPDNDLMITRKLSLPVDIDVRTNDKIVDCDTGLEYTATLPNNIKGHHKTVILTRTAKQVVL